MAISEQDAHKLRFALEKLRALVAVQRTLEALPTTLGFAELQEALSDCPVVLVRAKAGEAQLLMAAAAVLARKLLDEAGDELEQLMHKGGPRIPLRVVAEVKAAPKKGRRS